MGRAGVARREDVKHPRRLLDDSIAVVGMSCRFPGADTIPEFWDMLVKGRDAICPFPEGRENTYPNTGTEGVEGGFLRNPIDEFDAKFFGISPREAQFIDPQQRLLLEVVWEALESAGVAPRTLRGSATGSYCGIWSQDYEKLLRRTKAGLGGFSSSDALHLYLGNTIGATSCRVSHFLGLQGPNLALESGCASSLTSLHLACQALLAGEINMAISSGVNLVLGATQHGKLVQTSVLSREYRCKTFDESADGFVRAEGCGAVVLKRTADALQSGDKILALIRGSALSNDGGGTSFGTPNAIAQARLFREALRVAGVAPAEVSYVEAHGTGTVIGDPIEMYALSQAYAEGRDRTRPLYVGSVKTNIGHTESASGVAGLIKTILALQHRQIPAHLHFKAPQANIDLTVIPAAIPTMTTEWDVRGAGEARIAAVNAFSMSGQTAHVILQEAPDQIKQPPTAGKGTPQLITLSAKSEHSLQTLALQYSAYIAQNPAASLEDFAYTTNLCRAHNFPHRIALVAQDLAAAGSKLKNPKDCPQGKSPTVRPRLGFLFTGQGSQFVGMGRDLYSQSPPFAAAFQKCAGLFQERLGQSLEEVLWGEGGLLQQTLYCQPALFCIQYCLLAHWTALGVVPDFVLGHSVGEFAAAVAGGVFSLEEAFALVVERSRLVSELPMSAMLVLHCGRLEADELIKSFQGVAPEEQRWVDVAAVNSKAEVVVSCPKEIAPELLAFCAQRAVACQQLASSHAFHSRAMDTLLDSFHTAVVRVLDSREPRESTMECTYVSGTLARAMETQELMTPEYWTAHLRNTVQFQQAIQVEEGVDILLEIGPQPVLLGLAMSTLGDREGNEGIVYCPSMRRNTGTAGASGSGGEWHGMLTSMSKLYIAGVDLDSSRWYGTRKGPMNALPLPHYQFDRKRFWLKPGGAPAEPVDSSSNSVGGIQLQGAMCHPVLGHQVPSPLQQTMYMQRVSERSLPYLPDHRIGGRIVVPGAVFLEAALAVGREVLGGPTLSESTAASLPLPLTVTNLSIEAALQLQEAEQEVRLHTVVACTRSEAEAPATSAAPDVQFSIGFHRQLVAAGQQASGNGNWKRHASATFIPGTGAARGGPEPFARTLDFDVVKARLKPRDNASIAAMYKSVADVGIEFGPSFRSIAAAWSSGSSGGEVLTWVRLPQPEKGAAKPRYICHPVVLDAMIQTFVFGKVLDDLDEPKEGGSVKKQQLRLPVHIGKFQWMGREAPAVEGGEAAGVYVYAEIREDGERGPICLYDQFGDILAVMEGLLLVELSVDSFTRALRAESAPLPDFYQERWTPRVGVAQQRHELSTAFSKVTTLSPPSEGGPATLVRGLTNRLCFEYILKSVAECGWDGAGVESFVSMEMWRGKSPMIHDAFMAAMVEEGYLWKADQGGYYVLRPLPTPLESQAAIQDLEEQIEGLLAQHGGEGLDNEMKLYQYCQACAKQLGAVVMGHKQPTESHGNRVYPSGGDGMAVGVFQELIANLAPKQQTEKNPPASAPRNNILRILGVDVDGIGAKLQELLKEHGIKYEYTDVSTLGAGRQPQGSLSFDLDEDPLSQGFCPQYYDVVMAKHVAHAAKDLESGLCALRMVLRPHGALLLVEELEEQHFHRVSLALLDSWRPPLGGGEWSAALERAGLNDARVVQDRTARGHGVCIARAPDSLVKIHMATGWSQGHWLLVSRGTTPWSTTLIQRLGNLGRAVTLVTHLSSHGDVGEFGGKFQSANHLQLDFTDADKSKELFASILVGNFEGVVYLSTETGPASEFHPTEGAQYVEEHRCRIAGLLHLLQALLATTTGNSNVIGNAGGHRPRVYVITHGVEYLGDQSAGNPANATVSAAFRVFANETALFSCCSIDLDPDEQKPEESGALEDICAAFWGGACSKDKYIALRGGKKYAHQLMLYPKPSPPLPLPTNTERHQFFNPPSGSFSEIAIAPVWGAEQQGGALGDSGHHIEIAVRAVALNFRDLLCVLKPPGFEQYVKPGAGGVYDVGADISGVVVAVGPKVARFRVGDAVLGLAANGGLKSHATLHEQQCMPKPKGMTFAAAATVPVVFLTSHWCLTGLARLTPQDRVLIHVATGGVGLSAIQICLQLGVSASAIYATAGSRRKRAYLKQRLGIQHVYNSRNLEFEAAILRDTAGAGVSVVLNSLTGPGFKEATLACCGIDARFIEIGKLNIWSVEEVAGRRPDVYYKVVDLSEEEEAKEAFNHSLGQLEEFFTSGVYTPLPHTVFPLEGVRNAFYYFQEAKHIGKIVIKMPTPTIDPGKGGQGLGQMVLKHQYFDAESTYLITGGLGGLGVEVTKWMAENGAKHIWLAGRSPPDAQLAQLLHDLSARTSCSITTSETDVGDYTQCEALLERIKTSQGPPLRGIFLSAGFALDSFVDKQRLENFDAVFHSKVNSAWWLHHLTLAYDLDFFTMFSSVAALGGLGQTPHTAASRFLDSLAHYRLALGLPAATINWGAWSDVGAAARLKVGQEGLLGYRAMTPSQGIHALGHFLLHNYKQAFVVDAVDWDIVKQFMNLGSLLDELHGSLADARSDWDSAEDTRLVAEIRECAPEERQAKISSYIERLLKKTLSLPSGDVIDPDQNLQDLGVDSLLMMEMLNRMKLVLGESKKEALSLNALRENRTLRSLSGLLAQILNSDGESTSGAPVGAEEEMPTPPPPEETTYEEKEVIQPLEEGPVTKSAPETISARMAPPILKDYTI